MNKQKDPSLCKEHGVKKIRPYNSTILICPECEHQKRLASSKARISKNNELLKQSHMHEKKSSNTAGKTGKKTKTGRQKAMDRADMWFSRYIRLKYSVETPAGQICYCYTCGNPHGIKNIDNGHYVNREHKLVRFDDNNARPQCKYCNRHRSGRHSIFGIKLEKEVGSEEVDRLRQMSLFPGEDSEEFYREQADKYRNKFNHLLKEKQIPNPWK